MAAHYNTHTSSVSDLAAMRPDNIVPLALLGAGMIGVGPVPGNHLALHTLFAMTAFVSGGVGALLTAKAQRPSLRVIFRCLGITSLTSLVVGSFLIDWAPVARLGEGGAERWVVYPVIFWVLALGVIHMTSNVPGSRE